VSEKGNVSKEKVTRLQK